MPNPLIHKWWPELAYHNRGPMRMFKPVFIPLAKCYAAISQRRRNKVKPRRLSEPVISVGNITVGGVGKTPLVLFMVKQLKERGLNPAILMRGYKRKSTQPMILNIQSFDPKSIHEYGDEAGLLHWLSGVTIGIGGDRYQTGKQIIEQENCDVWVLDDGFQHYQLHRDCDVVVMDADCPLGNGHCLPCGPLREPKAVLEYADAFVFRGKNVPDLRDNALLEHKRCFIGSMHWQAILPLSEWLQKDYDSDRSEWSIQECDVILLSGIGTPERFERQAKENGFNVLHHYVYPDHFWYSEKDMKRIQAGTKHVPILTTEKDAVRFLIMESSNEMVLNNIHVVRTRWEMENSNQFVQWLCDACNLDLGVNNKGD